MNANAETTASGTPHPIPFGLVAGLGVGAGVFYYRALVNAHLERSLTPNIVMVHANVQ
jgi:aspartate racemase